MRKFLLTYCSFVFACTVVIAAFITATTYIQLAGAILLYPVLAFFAYKVLPYNWRHTKPPLQEFSHLPAKPTEKVEATARESIGISDIDKRVFLKLIGGAGVSLFLFSIFNKKAEGLFFKNLPVPGTSGTTASLQDIAGNKIDPAQKKPLDDYSISDIDNGVITFYGFINKNRSWYIMRVDTNTGAFRYTKDKSNFRANWSNRTNLKYEYFDDVFYA